MLINNKRALNFARVEKLYPPRSIKSYFSFTTSLLCLTKWRMILSQINERPFECAFSLTKTQCYFLMCRLDCIMTDNFIESPEGKPELQRFYKQKNSFDKPPRSIAKRRGLILNILLYVSSNFFILDLRFLLC